MKKSICMLALSWFSVCASADDAVADPEAWYRDAYAPLWAQNPAGNAEKMLAFYADTIETHSADGSVTRTDKATWLSEPHGYAYEYMQLWDKPFPEGQAPHQVASRPHGRIVFANSDAAASA